MKQHKFKIISGLLVVIILVTIVGYKMYNKPHINVTDAIADISIPASNLTNDFVKNENDANQKYVDKIIEVEGNISDISFENGIGIITLSDENKDVGIICQMLPEENKNILKIKRGNSIKIKGVCTGYLLDVMMVRCVLVNRE